MMRSTTILGVERDGAVAMAGDGQVTLGSQIMKGGARKVRRIYKEKILVGFAGSSADALTLRDQNESLRRRLNERDAELAELTFEVRSLRSSAVREWFVVGAGVLLGGIVLGLVLPTLRRKRRSEW